MYGYSDTCRDCPFENKMIYKSSRTIGNKNVTVTFEKFNDYLVESVRDTTRELQLINEIRLSQEENEEKQRQMGLLNKDLLRMNDQLKIAQNLINEELKQVGALQQSLLPESLPSINGYEFGSFYTPAEHAGGDYYDCIEMSNGYWGFTIADVSGHGTPAAVIMAMSRAIMRSYTYDVISSAEALMMVNEILCDNVHTRDFVTMFYTVFNSKTSELNYASAGHNPVLHFDKANMMVRKLSAGGMFLAAFAGMEYEEKNISLYDGDILFMYTDGLVEAMNSEREQYGLDRVISRLIMYSDTDCGRIIDEIMDDVRGFTGGKPFEDDVTIFVVKKL
jgi:sigma-B regulation protein RsbU (phosphoserine phosphatase)